VNEENMNIEAALKSLVALGATWVLWVLLALSVLMLAVILERLVFFARTRADAAALRVALERDARSLGSSVGERSIEVSILEAGLLADSPAEAEQCMAAEAQHQRLRSERNLAFLGTLGNNAPFVGLLGTVLGIIGAFQQLESARGQLTPGLMAEIGEALVATAVGLMVALPAVAAYNAFQRAIQVRLNRGDALGRVLIARLHRAGSAVNVAPQSGPQLSAVE
jgi:biopolymer transport protein ExbB